MRYFPFFFDLRGARALIVGGGEVAARKAELLARAGAAPRVVAPEVLPRLADLARDAGGEVRKRPYRKTDLRQCRVAVSAARDRRLNLRVRSDARAASVPVNVVDQPDLCDFIFPAFADRDPVCVAVSSGGASPVLARILRNQLEFQLPNQLGDLANFCEERRPQVQRVLPPKRRRHFWESVLNHGGIESAILNGDRSRAERLFEKTLAEFSAGPESFGPEPFGSESSGPESFGPKPFGPERSGPERSESEPSVGEVFLIGAGPGDPELMTFKGRRLLQKADVVFYDRLVSRGVLDLARRDAEKIFVGKTRARKVASQEEIHSALIDRARGGDLVARLKGGDPFVFGRGGEEAAALARAGIPFQVVPGITAANGCAAFAGIPLTHRGVARAVRLETAYREDMMSPERWKRLAGDREATLVFYMAGASLSAVADNLMLGGKSPQTPAAVVCGGTTGAQKVIRGALQNIAARGAKKVFSPALIIVGEAAGLGESLRWFSGSESDSEVPFSRIA